MIKDFSITLDIFLSLANKAIVFLSKFTFWDGILSAIAFWLIMLFLKRRSRYRLTSLSLPLPFNLGNATYELSEGDRIVAWKLHTQLKTRKAALLFDEEYDVIIDVYDSLYDLFAISRELLVNLHPSEIEKSPNIADLVFRVQNDGIRPHLTKWQAEFRRWWDIAEEDSANKNLRPQDIQKKYPKYKALIKEMKEMNLELIKYSEDLLKIAKTPRRLRHKIEVKATKIIPQPPI